MQSKQKINTVSLDILKVVIGEFEFKTRLGEFVWVSLGGLYFEFRPLGKNELAIIGVIITLTLRV